jgi:hypothetical protein
LAPDPANRAGRWGEFSCNSPWEVVEDVFRSARANHPQVDAIYITGDYIDHGKKIQAFKKLLKQNFLKQVSGRRLNKETYKLGIEFIIWSAKFFQEFRFIQLLEIMKVILIFSDLKLF